MMFTMSFDLRKARIIQKTGGHFVNNFATIANINYKKKRKENYL